MLYQIFETQRTLMEPFADFAQAASKLYSNAMSPLGQNQLAQRVAAGYDLLYRLGKDYEKPQFGIQSVKVDQVDVAIHERIEVDKPFCELRRFKRFTDDAHTLTSLKGQPVVLIVAPLSGHYATLLRDTVKTMLKDHKVYITDWKNARLVPLSEGEFHLDDYVNYVQDFIRYLQGHYGNCHVMSVCQPTVPVLAAVSLMASRGEKTPLSMTMMGGPIDATKSPTAVNNLAMNPDRHLKSHYDYFKDLIKGDNSSVESHRQFYDEYNAVLDMDADYYLETINTVFQEFKLVRGTWQVKSESGQLELVQPQDIRSTAMLTVEGELDDISGSGQTVAAHDLCTGIVRQEHHHLEVPGAGHYGIFSGRRWREVVYPHVKRFILEHQKATVPKTTAKASPAEKPKVARPAAKKAAAARRVAPVVVKKVTVNAAKKSVAAKPAAKKAVRTQK